MNSSDSPTAVILAGGLGTRLQATIPNQQKVMVKFANKPFIYRILDQLAAKNINNVILCTGHLGGQVRKNIGAFYKTLQIRYSQETTPLGTAGALRFALPLINSRTMLVMNGDSFCDIDLLEFLYWHSKRNARASIVVTHVEDVGRYGIVEINEGDQVTRFQEKGSITGPGWINAGIYAFDISIITSISPEKQISLEEEIFPDLTGKSFYGYQNPQGLFIDVGTPEALREAQALFSREKC